jgi:hypothetical protein
LFVRVKRGFYIPNPCLALDLDGTWVSLRDLLHFDLLERENKNRKLTSFLNMVGDVEHEVKKFYKLLARPVTAALPVLPQQAATLPPPVERE